MRHCIPFRKLGAQGIGSLLSSRKDNESEFCIDIRLDIFLEQLYTAAPEGEMTHGEIDKLGQGRVIRSAREIVEVNCAV